MVSTDCEPTSAYAHHNRNFPNGMWCTMREEFASYSFLDLSVAGLILLCSSLLAIAFV
jgi:hypothetical protein